MADGQVVFEITADGKKAMASIDDITKAFQKAGKEWEQSAGNSAQNMESAFTRALDINRVKDWALKAGKSMLDFGMDCIAAASDLQEVQNVVDVTFGSSANQIESWAKKAQTQFGLTETQAKRFTSTLGAMMKSAGLTGPEIVSMSTDLAGLAADMASFYNMDFETAFQKIRSGISGETEPLKQLGINMSVANLEAYALSQGITKAFDKMSQGEQTMLRYQYLMQATADAQGDFARTSDGYANAQRRVQTAMESIKTSVGNVLLPVIGDITSGIASLLEKITAPAETTIFDQFSEIDLKTESKLADIRKTADEANAMIGVLQNLSKESVENSSLSAFISGFTDDLSSFEQAVTKAKNGDVTGAISNLASALSTNLSGDPKKWETLLGAISSNLGGVTSATMTDGEKTAAWMKAAADAADELGGDYSTMWASLLKALGDNAGAAINALIGGENTGATMKNIASGANVLQADSPEAWTGLLNALKNADGLGGMFDASDARNIESLARALSSADPSEKKQAWTDMLSILSQNADAVASLTGKNADDTKQWLEQLAGAANTLDAGSADGWAKLFTALKEGFPGLDDTGTGAEFFAAISRGFLNLYGESDQAAAAISALGDDTSSVTEKQRLWLDVCQRLVQTIPGLSAIVNTQTGEVKGGIDALKEYVSAWERAEKQTALLGQINEKRALLAPMEQEAQRIKNEIEIQKMLRESRRQRLAEYEQWVSQSGHMYDMDAMIPDSDQTLRQRWEELNGEIEKTTKTIEELEVEYADLEPTIRAATEALDEQEQAVKDQLGMDDLNKTAKEAAGSMTILAKAANQDTAALSQVETAVSGASEALKNLNDYVENVRAETARTVSQTINGFTAMGKSVGGVWQYFTPAEQARQTLQDLTKQMNELRAAGEDASGLEKTFADTNSSLPTIESMTTALQSQAAYMKQYQDYLDRARAAGVSEDILATLSDGTQESFDYLQALSRGGVAIKDLNKAWKEAKDASQAFTDTLTNNKLTVDEEFQQLLEKANEAIEAMKTLDPAAAASQIVADIASGIAAQVPSVAAQVDAVLAELGRLNNIGSVGIGGLGAVGGVITFSGGGASSRIGSHADGLDYVPFDGYLSQLHEGESILTAEEARVWRQFKYNQQPNTIDYGMLGTAMWENAPQIGGGNVYLNGQIVGRVMSAQQADSLRAMERSGFQK